MNIGFRKIYKGKPTHFPDRIMAGIKIHTFRADDTNRWHAGSRIDMSTGVRTKEYNKFYESLCTGFQIAQLSNHGLFTVSVDGRILSRPELLQVAINDGFDSLDEFIDWFNPVIKYSLKKLDQPLRRKIIHWTDFRY